MEEARFKKIMADLGMPDSHSLLSALRQVANEAAQGRTAGLIATAPKAGSVDAQRLIEAKLAEYDWPANHRNAARAGWEACRGWLVSQAGAPGDRPPSRDPEGQGNPPDWHPV